MGHVLLPADGINLTPERTVSWVAFANCLLAQGLLGAFLNIFHLLGNKWIKRWEDLWLDPDAADKQLEEIFEATDLDCVQMVEIIHKLQEIQEDFSDEEQPTFSFAMSTATPTRSFAQKMIVGV